MSSSERPASPESQSVWNSRLFRFGVLLTIGGVAAGAITGDWKPAVVGVVLTGIATASWKRQDK